MTGEVTPYKMAIWRYVSARDLESTNERLRPTIAPPPMCMRREADLKAGMDDMSRYAVETAKEKK